MIKLTTMTTLTNTQIPPEASPSSHARGPPASQHAAQLAPKARVKKRRGKPLQRPRQDHHNHTASTWGVRAGGRADGWACRQSALHAPAMFQRRPPPAPPDQYYHPSASRLDHFGILDFILYFFIFLFCFLSFFLIFYSFDFFHTYYFNHHRLTKVYIPVLFVCLLTLHFL